MGICAKYIILGIYGPKWAGATMVLRLLCFAGMLRGIFHLAGSVVHATGKVYFEVRRQFIFLVLLTAGSLLGVKYGIEGVAAAFILGSLWMYLSMAQLVINIIRSNWRTFFYAQLPGLIIGFIVGIADVAFIFLFEHFLPKNMILLKLFLLIGSSALALFLSLTYLPRQSKGEMPAWIANEYRHYIPVPIRGWVLQHL